MNSRHSLVSIGNLSGWILFFLVSCKPLVGLAEQASWKQEPGYRWKALATPASGHVGFTRLPPADTGLAFTNALSIERSLTNQIYLNGSGVAAGDVDGDGWCDLYFCGLDRGNTLYRNLGGWHFQDITDAAGVRCPGLDSTGATFVDIDGDGDLDLLVNTIGHGTRCFLNDGKGHFSDVTATMGLGAPHGSTSLALADVNGDGFLDLYVANYRMNTLRDMPNTRFHVQMIQGKPTVTTVNGRSVNEPDLRGRYDISPGGGVIENGEMHSFYLNQGGTNFLPVSFTSGSFQDEDGQALKEPFYDWGLSAMFRDLNGDGLPDLYVCNDFDAPDRVWINQGHGVFRAISRLALRHTSLFSMGVDVADINRDGLDDIFVADMLSRDHQKRLTQLGDTKNVPNLIGAIDNRPQYKVNTLFLSRGDGTYAEIANYADLDASEWTWAPVFLDVDLDGYEDLLITNGHERDAQNIDIGGQMEVARRSGQIDGTALLQARRRFPRLATANLAFRNQRDLTFKETGKEWGFDAVGVSQGMALADLDNDGDLDIVINDLNGPAIIYRNEANAPRIAVRLKGLPPNTQGIGAKIRVTGGPVSQSQEIICGGRYLSSDDTVRVFAAGSLSNHLSIEVTWRSGKKSVIQGAVPNGLYEVDEQGGRESNAVASPAPSPLFEDVSDRIAHVHTEEPFNDFEIQSLLPKRLSQFGPGVSWFDLNGDGYEDLIIGSGKGGLVGAFQNDGRGGFVRFAQAPFDQPMTRDVAGILGAVSGNKQASVLAGSANYEDGVTNGSSVRIFEMDSRSIMDTFPGGLSSTGPLALADVDGDGDLDLFVGGRGILGRYPEAASSTLFRADNGRFKIDESNADVFKNVGLVSGAVFSDLNGDGYSDLVLACEWGPVKVFLNDHGRFREATAELGLKAITGWWNGVTTGDFDGDGRLDIIASNWGLNSGYQASQQHPQRIYYKDFDQNGTLEIIEAHYDSALKKEVPERDLGAMAAAIPALRERYGSFAAFSAAGVDEILSGPFQPAGRVEANSLASMVFFNRGDHFEAVALPLEAQWTPAFGIVAADFDGDGNEDLVLSQNFFAVQPGLARCDAGRGLWLKGDGHGGFKSTLGQESGLAIYGEQRGAAAADYDHDGRLDLVVTQNGAATKLLHNIGAKPGLRIRAKAGSGNPNGIGAVIRVQSGQRWGAAREIHSGSGYWSQDGSVQVMAMPEAQAKISVRWPGGKTTTLEIPAHAKEIEVDETGLRALR